MVFEHLQSFLSNSFQNKTRLKGLGKNKQHYTVFQIIALLFLSTMKINNEFCDFIFSARYYNNYVIDGSTCPISFSIFYGS